jgi:hypothetical protein
MSGGGCVAALDAARECGDALPLARVLFSLHGDAAS